MSIRWLLAALHLFGLGVGLGAVWARSRALRGTLDTAGIRRVLQADTWWGIAALVWISTGLLRAFAGFEKGTTYLRFARTSVVQAILVLLMVIAATGMARGYGA